jgi:tetratricopeptide (TPR) repeat protein
MNARYNRGEEEAIPHLKRAVELDPNFAIAWANLGQAESNINEPVLGEEYIRKAYALRDRTSETERFYVDTHYFQVAEDDETKAIEVYKAWAEAYPHDLVPFNNLSVAYQHQGKWEESLTWSNLAVKNAPDDVIPIYARSWTYVGLGRFDDAKTTIDQAVARGSDTSRFHFTLYILAFLRNDRAAMDHELAEAPKYGPGAVADITAVEAMTQAYHGKLNAAKAAFRRAYDVAHAASLNGSMASALYGQACAEALAGDTAAARRDTAPFLAITNAHLYRMRAARVFALAGDEAQAEALLNTLLKERPNATVLNNYDAPVIRAQIELARNNPAKAIEALEPTFEFELADGDLGSGGGGKGMLANYLRAEAYLKLGKGAEAAAEYQKIIDHPGIVRNHMTGALAHWGLGRAYAVEGDQAKARLAYQDFFALWKDADPDVPVLRQAKAEYAKLK